MEIIDGRRGYYKDLLQGNFRNNASYTNRIYDDNAAIRGVVAEALSRVEADPIVDSRSLLFENVQDKLGSVHVLSVPAGEILLPSTKEILATLPQIGTTFYMKGVSYDNKVRQEIFTAENESVARRVGSRMLRDIGWRRDSSTKITIRSITPEQFELMGLKLIDAGRDLDDRVLRYGRLRAYYEQKFEERRQARAIQKS